MIREGKREDRSESVLYSTLNAAIYKPLSRISLHSSDHFNPLMFTVAKTSRTILKKSFRF